MRSKLFLAIVALAVLPGGVLAQVPGYVVPPDYQYPYAPPVPPVVPYPYTVPPYVPYVSPYGTPYYYPPSVNLNLGWGYGRGYYPYGYGGYHPYYHRR
jgi:hypothetical protein